MLVLVESYLVYGKAQIFRWQLWKVRWSTASQGLEGADPLAQARYPTVVAPVLVVLFAAQVPVSALDVEKG